MDVGGSADVDLCADRRDRSQHLWRCIRRTLSNECWSVWPRTELVWPLERIQKVEGTAGRRFRKPTEHLMSVVRMRVDADRSHSRMNVVVNLCCGPGLCAGSHVRPVRVLADL